MPEKVKIYIEKNLLEELKYFQKKYLFKIEILSDQKLIIPEYKIELLNKSKKLINSIENIDKISEVKKIKKEIIKEKKELKKDSKKELKKETKKNKKEIKKKKTKNTLRTLWVRRKKKS